MTVSANQFATETIELLQELPARVGASLAAAADLMADGLRSGGIVQAFGTGHSQAAAFEVAGRAGGLIPTNRIALADLVHFGGQPPTTLADPLLERSPGLAERLLALVSLDPADVFVIASSSGINNSVVDMALEVRRRGHAIIAITSAAHSASVESRHPSGLRLSDVADVVLDNLAPTGDSLLPLPSGQKVCAVSSITTAMIVQMLVAEVVSRLLQTGHDPLVYISANTPGGHERNVELEARYAGRLRRWAV